MNFIPLSHPTIKKLTYLAVGGAGPVLLGAEGLNQNDHPLSCPTVKKLTYLAVVGAGPVLLGAEGPAGGVAWSALGAHLGLQQTQLHQHRAVQAQAHLVCSDWPGGQLD